MLDDKDEFGTTYSVIAVHGLRSRKEYEDAIRVYTERYGGVWVVEHNITWFKNLKTWFCSWSIVKEVEHADQAGHV